MLCIAIISTLFGVGALFLLRYGLMLEFDYVAQLQNDNVASVASSVKSAFAREREAKPDVYTMLAVGDIMLDRGVEARALQNGGFNFIFDRIQSTLNDADIVFGNLEGPISDRGTDTGKKYSFRFLPETAPALQLAGFDVLALANNHGLDWGRGALCDTFTNLIQVQIQPIGGGCNAQSAERPVIITLDDGTQVGFLAYTEFYKGGFAREDTPGFAQYSMDNMTQRIRQLSQQVDVVMVSLHWGHEYHLRSNEAQQELAYSLIDAGANVILGHHPHVIQEIERHKDGWIVYSLGNFVFDQKFSEQTMQGLMARLYIVGGEVQNIQPIIVSLNDNYQPHIKEPQQYASIDDEALEEMHREYHQVGAPR